MRFSISRLKLVLLVLCLGCQPRQNSNKALSSKDADSGNAGNLAALPPEVPYSEPMVQELASLFSETLQSQSQKSVSRPQILADLMAMREALWNAAEGKSEPSYENLRNAGMAYTVDGVPALVNSLVKGMPFALQSEDHALTMDYLMNMSPARVQPSKSGLLKYVETLFRFASSQRFAKPKIVFHATAFSFKQGQIIPAFLSTTEDLATATHYIAGAGRRVVTFILQGSPQKPAPGGIIKQWNERRKIWQWNEIVLPPHVYRVEKVEEKAFGPLVWLEVKSANMEADLASILRDKVAPLIPDSYRPSTSP